MFGKYRFLKTRNGRTNFARVAFESEQSVDWEVIYPDKEHIDYCYWDDIAYCKKDIEIGIGIAKEAHEALSEEFFRIALTLLHINFVDFTPDTVQCAAAIAAWKSFGHSEDEVEIVREDDMWKVVFP